MSLLWNSGKWWQVFGAYIRQGIGVDNNHLIVTIVYLLSCLRLKVVAAYIVECKLQYYELKPWCSPTRLILEPDAGLAFLLYQLSLFFRNACSL